MQKQRPLQSHRKGAFSMDTDTVTIRVYLVSIPITYLFRDLQWDTRERSIRENRPERYIHVCSPLLEPQLRLKGIILSCNLDSKK